MGDIPGPSTSPYFSPQKATDNFSRLCQLILTICSELFRDVLSHYISPTDLRSMLDKSKTKLERILNADQKKLIYPATGGASLAAKDLDISVLYIILRNICSIPPHKKGWGNPPLKGDSSIAACIEIIRIQRNFVIGHSTSGKVDNVEFQSHWNELTDSVVEIEKQLIGGDLYKRNIEVLLICDLNPIRVEMYQKEFKQLQDTVTASQERIEDLEIARNRVDDELRIKKEKIESITSSCQDIQVQIHLKEERINQLEKNVEEQRGEKRKNLDFSEGNQDEGRMTQLEKIIKEHHGRMSQLEKMIEEQHERLSELEKNNQGNTSRQLLLNSAVLTSKINVPGMTLIRQIAYIKFGRLWASDYKTLKQVDINGSVIRTVNDAVDEYRAIAVTENGDLLYVHNNGHSIQKTTQDVTTFIMCTSEHEKVECMHSSQINGDILLGLNNSLTKNWKLARYSRIGEKIQDIEMDDQGQRLFIKPVFITENMNGDIITSDFEKEAVVVVDRSGKHRFNYPADCSQTEFVPGDICTDTYGHILVINDNLSVYLLDQDGILLTQMLTPEQLKFIYPFALCVHDKHVYVGGESGRIEVYKYLKDS